MLPRDVGIDCPWYDDHVEEDIVPNQISGAESGPVYDMPFYKYGGFFQSWKLFFNVSHFSKAHK